MNPDRQDAVLLLAHGAPERVEDVEQYLAFVRAGRPANSKVTEEVRQRYAAIGGSSPLLRWTREQAQALERSLGVPVFFAMRNWQPFICDVVPGISAARLAAICLAPQFSEMSVGLYMQRTNEVRNGHSIVWARSYHDQPLLIETFAARLRPLLPRRCSSRPTVCPRRPSPREIRTPLSAAPPLPPWPPAPGGILRFRLPEPGNDGGSLAQSDSRIVSRSLRRRGVREVVIHPIGFVCDHVEILYDIDIQFREYAAGRGIAVFRPESLNDSLTFTAALAEVAKQCLA